MIIEQSIEYVTFFLNYQWSTIEPAFHYIILVQKRVNYIVQKRRLHDLTHERAEARSHFLPDVGPVRAP